MELDSAKKKAKELASSKSTEIDAAQTLAELDAIIAELDESVATAVAAESSPKKEVLNPLLKMPKKLSLLHQYWKQPKTLTRIPRQLFFEWIRRRL